MVVGSHFLFCYCIYDDMSKYTTSKEDIELTVHINPAERDFTC